VLLTLFYVLLIAWIAGVIHFFNLGAWNWLLLAGAVLLLLIRGFAPRRRWPQWPS
jgi:hypothetical protein